MPKVSHVCPQCNQEFLGYSCKSQQRKYCSYECSNLARSNRVEKLCAFCGKPFVVKRTEPKTICCSWVCRVKRLHFRMRPGRPKYWTQLRRRILDRDGWTCQKCNLVSFNGGLHVHHIIHKKNGGTEIEENLITLCNPCHKAEHRQKEN
jgi:5-methylcytosine-specific restriction endonuclease McrA